ncbi:MAG: BrnT family toxin [Zoogloeaceae bacterium]|nr:BrnT family toxin [Zoogloeaceae bacterium]
MEIAFDPAKDASNIAKHGMSLAIAAEFEWESAAVWPDVRREYGEARMAAIGYIGLRLYAVVFVDRAHVRRIISLRKANLREVKRYAEA